MNEIKAQYDFLLEQGELEIFCPKMTGVWEKDKKDFTEKWEQNNDFEVEGWLDLDD